MVLLRTGDDKESQALFLSALLDVLAVVANSGEDQLLILPELVPDACVRLSVGDVAEVTLQVGDDASKTLALRSRCT